MKVMPLVLASSLLVAMTAVAVQPVLAAGTGAEQVRGKPNELSSVRLAQAATNRATTIGPSRGVEPPGTGSTPEDRRRGIVSESDAPAPEMPGPSGLVFEGVDRRVETTRRYFSELPFSAIGVVEVKFANGVEQQGTGFLVDPGVVLTAGHVLYSHLHGPAILARFSPGCTAAGAPRPQIVDTSRMRVSAAWRLSEAIDGDYAAIFLPLPKLYAACGVFSTAVIAGSYVKRHVAQGTREFMIAGFPGEKPLGSMWSGTGGLVNSDAGMIQHKIDTTPGQSGAPLFAAIIDETTKQRLPLAIGIHSRPSPNENHHTNQARRIDGVVVNDLKRWWLEFYSAGR